MWAHGQLLGHRHRARRSGALAVAADQLAQAGGRPALPRLRRPGLRRRQDRRPRDRSRVPRARAWTSPGTRAGGEVVLPVYYFLAVRHRPRRGLRVARPPAARSAAADRSRPAQAVLLDYPMTGLPAPDPAGAAVELQVALRRPGEQPDDIRPLVGPSYLQRCARGSSTPATTCRCWRRTPPPAGRTAGLRAARGRRPPTAATLETVAPPWLRDTNLDPRLRVAAGLGAEVVRHNQDRYVESAWRQVGDVLAANALRRRGEFSLAASATLHRQVDLAAVGDRPRHLDRARPCARVRRAGPHDHRPPAAVAAAALHRVGRVPSSHSRAREGDGVACRGRAGGARRPLGGAAAAERRGRRSTRSTGSTRRASVWGAAAVPAILAAARPRAQPDRHDA